MNSETFLSITKSKFKSDIKKRILNGVEILNMNNEKINISYSKWDSYNIELLKRSFNNPNNEYQKEYEHAFYLNRSLVGVDQVTSRKRTIQLKLNKLESFIERIDLIPISTKKDNMKQSSTEISNKIFIVHGHDTAMKLTTARTLEKLKLEPIILHEQTDRGKTIIEKFEEKGAEVGFAIILLTADDEGKAKTKTNLKSRARQNVVFEMGYFIGKLGRERVFLLLENDVEKPGDLDGIIYTSIDVNGAWKSKLVKELRACGYNVTADDLD